MTCSILSAIIASTKVENCARKPRWRIAAKDRFGAGEAVAGADFVSDIKNRQCTAPRESHIRPREQWTCSDRCHSRGRTPGVEPRTQIKALATAIKRVH